MFGIFSFLIEIFVVLLKNYIMQMKPIYAYWFLRFNVKYITVIEYYITVLHLFQRYKVVIKYKDYFTAFADVWKHENWKSAATYVHPLYTAMERSENLMICEDIIRKDLMENVCFLRSFYHSIVEGFISQLIFHRPIYWNFPTPRESAPILFIWRKWWNYQHFTYVGF